MTRIGILHPGAMGAEVGRCLVGNGHEVRWCAEGRSGASHRRAGDAGLVGHATLEELISACGALISVCPPASAEAVAAEVAAAGFAGRYVDANAIAPASARRVASIVGTGGATFVDGGIVGGPPTEPGTTRLYLSGDRADEVAGWFEGSNLGTVVIGDEIGAASALKAAFAGWTKGSAALLLAVRAFARAEGVEEVLLDEWSTSLPEVRDRSDAVASRIHHKAWRFAGELEEIGDALAHAGLPSGFHHAAADLYERLADLKDTPGRLDPDEVLDRLLPGGRS